MKVLLNGFHLSGHTMVSFYSVETETTTRGSTLVPRGVAHIQGKVSKN